MTYCLIENKKMFTEIEQDNLAEIVNSNKTVVVQYSASWWKLPYYETKIQNDCLSK